MKENTENLLNLVPIKGLDENGKEVILCNIPIPKPDDWYIYKDGKKYLNDKYF